MSWTMRIIDQPDEVSHPLNFIKALPNGDEEWACQICGYQRLINLGLPPARKNVTINWGDFFAPHDCTARPDWHALEAIDLQMNADARPFAPTDPIAVNPYAPIIVGGGACAACARPRPKPPM